MFAYELSACMRMHVAIMLQHMYASIYIYYIYTHTIHANVCMYACMNIIFICTYIHTNIHQHIPHSLTVFTHQCMYADIYNIK
jgi:hypothetical protein